MNNDFDWRRQLVEDAVNPEAKLAAVLERFEVNIAGAVAQGLLEYLIDHPDDAAVGVRRGRSVEVEDVLVLVLVVSVLFDPGELPALTDGLALLIGSVQGVDPGLDERQGGDHRVDPQPGQELKFIDHSHFLGRDEGHVENFVADRHRADELVDAELLGQQDGKLVIRRAGQGDVQNQGQEQLLGVEVGDLLVRDVTALDQEDLGRSAGAGSLELLFDLLELLGIEPVAPGQNIEDQGSNIGELKHCSHKSISIRGWGAMPLETIGTSPTGPPTRKSAAWPSPSGSPWNP